MENLQEFTNEQFGTVRCFIDDNGTAHLNVEDVARGLGFTRIADSGNVVVRWERVNAYLYDLGFMPTSGHAVSKDDFIPENIFYRLAMKAKNAAAEKFQAWIADDVIPNIRKFGFYSTTDAAINIINNPDFLIQLANKLKQQQSTIKRQQLTITDQQYIIDNQRLAIDTMTPKADYYDRILSSKGLVTATDIAKDYGYSAVKFNRLLNDLKVQFKQSGRWYLYAEYADKGWTKQVSNTHTNSAGEDVTTFTMKWTLKGRIALYQLLKEKGILPVLERESKRAERRRLFNEEFSGYLD